MGFTSIFVINLVIRVLGLAWKNFLKSNWDLYALLSVSGTSITTVLLLAGYEERTFIQLQKLFLVSVSYLIQSLPANVNLFRKILMMLIPRNDDLDHLFKTAASVRSLLWYKRLS